MDFAAFTWSKSCRRPNWLKLASPLAAPLKRFVCSPEYCGGAAKAPARSLTLFVVTINAEALSGRGGWCIGDDRLIVPRESWSWGGATGDRAPTHFAVKVAFQMLPRCSCTLKNKLFTASAMR
jgi:hypothetical protein